MPGQQRAAVFTGSGQIRLEEVSLSTPAPNHVRVRLQGCGICASSLPLWEGREWFTYPQPAGTPGHEGWGLIDAVGTGVDDLDVGDRVALVSQHAFSEYDTAPRHCVVRLPKELAHEPFPGEPLGCVMNIFERSNIGRGQRVAIVGAGFLGLLLTQLAAAAGAHVTLLSQRQCALRLGAAIGAEHTISTLAADAAEHAMEQTDRLGFERVIEAVGLQSTLDLAGALTAERGRLVIAGYHQEGPRHVDMQQWNWRGIDVVNAHERSVQRYVHGVTLAIDAVLDGRIDPFPLLTHSVGLGALERGFELARARPDGFIKAVMINEAAA